MQNIQVLNIARKIYVFYLVALIAFSARNIAAECCEFLECVILCFYECNIAYTLRTALCARALFINIRFTTI